MIEYMRAALSLPSDVPVDLWSVPDPPDKLRPGASLQVLICLAICSSEKKMLPLQGIHRAIAARFPFYRRYEKWQVRTSSLTLRACVWPELEAAGFHPPCPLAVQHI